MIDPRSEQELVGGGDTLLHYHLADRATNAKLQSDSRVVLVSSATYNATESDDFIVVDNSTSAVAVALPVARNLREIEVMITSSAYAVTITPQTGDTVMGDADAVLSVAGTAIRFKAISSDWKAI